MQPRLSSSVSMAILLTLAGVGSAFAQHQNLRALGLEPDDFWVDYPSPSEISFRAERENGDAGLVVGRLWLSDVLNETTVDTEMLELIRISPRGPQHLALIALVDDDSVMMAQAREDFLAEPYTGRVLGGGVSSLHSMILALDWIRWTDEDDFARAFSRVMDEFERTSDTGFHPEVGGGGYWHNDAYYSTRAVFEPLLVAVASGRTGAFRGSTPDAWAQERLTHLHTDPVEDPEALFSPYVAANVLSIMSRDGGGAEMGTSERGGDGVGGYELYYAAGGVYSMHGWDTATGGASQLMERCLYFRTRSKGLAFTVDDTVTQSSMNGHAYFLVNFIARRFNDGVAQWVLEHYPDARLSSSHAGLKALSGGLAPAPEVPSEQSGLFSSMFHFRSDPASPSSTFRVAFSARQLDHFRGTPDDRILSFAYGTVGLVRGHFNRTRSNGWNANGVHIAPYQEDGVTPETIESNWWSRTAHYHPYWAGRTPSGDPITDNGRRATTPETVATNPAYLINTDRPRWEGSQVLYDLDWMEQVQYGTLGDMRGGELAALITQVESSYAFSPEEGRLIIEDTVAVSDEMYLGWHFSPSRIPTYIENGFVITEGDSSVRVTIEGLDGTSFERVETTSLLGDDTGIDWRYANERIPVNVGYVPSERRAQHRVRITLQANVEGVVVEPPPTDAGADAGVEMDGGTVPDGGPSMEPPTMVSTGCRIAGSPSRSSWLALFTAAIALRLRRRSV